MLLLGFIFVGVEEDDHRRCFENVLKAYWVFWNLV